MVPRPGLRLDDGAFRFQRAARGAMEMVQGFDRSAGLNEGLISRVVEINRGPAGGVHVNGAYGRGVYRGPHGGSTATGQFSAAGRLTMAEATRMAPGRLARPGWYHSGPGGRLQSSHLSCADGSAICLISRAPSDSRAAVQPGIEASRLTGLSQTKLAALLRFGAIGVMLSLTGCAVGPEPGPVYRPAATALAKVRLDPVAATAKLNAYRAEEGLNPVRLDPALTAMAERQAQAMAQSGTMSHEVAGSLSARLAASGINAPTGENLGAGYMSFDEALAGWRASAGHNANLLMSGATRFGIALAKNPSDAYGAYWAMEVGAEPRSGGAPVAVWLFPLPIVVFEPR